MRRRSTTRARTMSMAAAAVLATAIALSTAACAPAAPVASPSATRGASSAPIATLAPATPRPATPTRAPARTPTPDRADSPVGPTETALVVRVVDGDTLIIDRGRGEERLRYVGIDAPESVKPDTPVEFMGHEAALANAALVDGAEVVLERDVSDTDRFGRLLRYVWLHDGDTWTLVNLELVRDGFANAVSFPPDVRRQAQLRRAERTARSQHLGLWGPPTSPP